MTDWIALLAAKFIWLLSGLVLIGTCGGLAAKPAKASAASGTATVKIVSSAAEMRVTDGKVEARLALADRVEPQLTRLRSCLDTIRSDDTLGGTCTAQLLEFQ